MTDEESSSSSDPLRYPAISMTTPKEEVRLLQEPPWRSAMQGVRVGLVPQLRPEGIEERKDSLSEEDELIVI